VRAPRIVLITDPSFGDGVILRAVRAVAEALEPGALCVQLRDKRRSDGSLRLFALELRRLTRDTGASLVVNGRPHVARDAGADGVHLGGDGGSVADARARLPRGAWVSVAAHTDDDVRRAMREGADAVLVSPIFPTRSPSSHGAGVSPEKRARGTEALRAARTLRTAQARGRASARGKDLAIFALGGVTISRVGACVRAGADGVALIRALLGSASPGADARAIDDALARR
jgi:thiamine-phosphate pyrophosphorylase